MEDNKTFEEYKVNAFNNSQGTLDECDCPICKNKGFIQEVQFSEMYNDYITVTRMCKCMKKREIIRKARNSGLGEYVHMKMDDYKCNEQWQTNIKKNASEYINSDNDKWFIMLGQSGSGKTMMCSIIANELLKQGKEVVYITWTDFIAQLKRDVMSDRSKTVTQYMDDIKNSEVLFIDELLKKYNETDLKYIIEIINYRYSHNLKTIITSERNINELLDIDEATMSRMVEKADKSIYNIAKDRKKNYRLKNII